MQLPSERSFRGKALGSAALVFLVALFVYFWTLAPTVTLVDSGELIVAARFLGVAHPPGFPLYVMLAHLASLLPIGNVAARINFASAFFAALACAMLTLVVAELIVTASYVAELQRRSKKAARKGRKISPHSMVTGAEANSSWLLTIAPAIGAGLLLAFSRTLWSYATIAEVYTLNAFLILTIFFLMLRWRRRVVEDERSTSVTRARARPQCCYRRLRFLALCSGGRIRPRARRSSRHRCVDSARAGDSGLQDSRAQIFCEQEIVLCGRRFTGRVARCLQLPSAGRRAQSDLELGRPSFASRNLGARHGQAVSALSIIFAEYHGRAVSSARPIAASRIWPTVDSNCPPSRHSRVSLPRRGGIAPLFCGCSFLSWRISLIL